jgi:hypothetical protein
MTPEGGRKDRISSLTLEIYVRDLRVKKVSEGKRSPLARTVRQGRQEVPLAVAPAQFAFPAVQTHALDVLGKIWASPYTVIGAVYGALGHLYGLLRRDNPKILLGNNAIQFTNNPFVNSAAAITFGNTIVYGRNSPPDRNGAYGNDAVNVGRHERAHTYQYQALGPAFGLAYLLAGGFCGPDRNAFERAAQQYGAGCGSWWPWADSADPKRVLPTRPDVLAGGAEI